MATFTCDFSQPAKPFTHYWEHTVGSGHAPLALRADWQAQLLRCHQELGFRYVRFHALLSDAMSTLTREGDKLIYSFFNADQIIDFLLSIGMRPFVELSFMPEGLASGTASLFHYRANVTPPREYGQWNTLIRKLVTHWQQRYGAAEVREWFFEVWNEPNLKTFWTGSQDDYFKLYRGTAETIKSVDGSFKVGGPATADNQWIGEFVDFCNKNSVPVDFVSTHHYPTDAFGKKSSDTLTELQHTHPGVMRDEVVKVRGEAHGLPLYYTEWNCSSNPRDPLHDESFAAAFATRIVMDGQGLAEGYSFWTFSDIFDENYFPSVPFQGGFGLLNIHGIAKPVYRAFQLMHHLGDDQVPIEGAHPTVSAWVVRKGTAATLLLTNLAMPRHPIHTEMVNIRLVGAPDLCSASIERIDEDHANPRGIWHEMGEPAYLSALQVKQLETASTMRREAQAWTRDPTGISVSVSLPPQSIAAITFEFDGSVSLNTTKKEDIKPAPNPGGTNTEMLEGLLRETFEYFLHEADPATGLIADKSQPGSPASTASVGMALSAYVIAAKRSMLSRSEAIEKTLRSLRFFHLSRQGPESDASGYKGFYYHFLDMSSGRRAGQCELSTMDTAMLMAGMLTAAGYFTEDNPQENEIRELAESLYCRVDWKWALDGQATISHGWKPESGFLPHRWDTGYSEALMLYTLASGSPTYSIGAAGYQEWTSTFEVKKVYDIEYIYAGPLFIHQLSHSWIDFRGIWDAVNHRTGFDYFENSRRASYVHRQYAIKNPHGFKCYGKLAWGLTASDGPGPAVLEVDGVRREFYNYIARGAPFGPDDGTISPWAVAASLPFAPEVVLDTVRHAIERLELKCYSPYGFDASFNPTFPESSKNRHGWISPWIFGLNQGPIMLMIENFQSGLIWKIMRDCPYIRTGLHRLGFRGGWLSS